MTIQLGDRVRYKITGFAGIATGRTSFLYQCDQIFIQPEKLDKDGKPVDGHWYDEPWIEVVKAGVHTPKAAVEVVEGGKRRRVSGADMLELNNINRFRARREADQRRGASLGTTPSPRVVHRDSARSASRSHLAHTPLLGLLLIVVGSSLCLWGLAVYGAYSLIQAVVGQ